MIKLCIFDMDGTLVNTIDTIAHFGNKALDKFGFKPIDTDRYKILVGNGSEVLIERMIREVGAPEEIKADIHKYYTEIYDNDFMYLTDSYSGVVDMLKNLKEQSVVTAVLSNKDHATAQKVSEELFKDGVMDMCYGARPGISLKPAPDAVFEIIEKVGVDPKECLYIGDTATDIQTAKNAGLFSVGVLWGFRDESELKGAGANLIVRKPMEIADYVMAQNSVI